MKIVIRHKKFWEELPDGTLVPVTPPTSGRGRQLFSPAEITTSTWLKKREQRA